MTSTGSNQSFFTQASLADCAKELVDQHQEKPQESMNVTLVFSKLSRQVMCVEAGNDFVDLLLSFLTLPMGCIVKLLSDASLLSPQESISPGLSTASCQRDLHGKALASISNVYNSVIKMDNSLLRIDKGLLLDSRPQIPGVCVKLLPFPLQENDKKEVNYYCCGNSCNSVSHRYGIRCPRHKRKMDTPCKLVDSFHSYVERQGDSKFSPGCYLKEPGLQGKVRGGYTKSGTSFVITNNLEIYPSSAIKGLANLKILQNERISDLDNLDTRVRSEEVLELLKASVCSSNVLNKVFGKYIKKSVASPLPPYVTLLPNHKQSCRSCPSSATPGKRATAGQK